jgi:hypothetical protein
MYWTLGHNSELSAHNKFILNKQVISPVWNYGIQLWGCASNCNIEVIQCYQNKVLKCIVSTPWYIQNSDHRDLLIETVTDIIANHHHHLYLHKSSTVQDVEKSIQIQNKQYRVQCQYSYRGK